MRHILVDRLPLILLAIVLTLATLTLAPDAQAQNSPFGVPGAAPAEAAPPAAAGWFEGLMLRVQAVQQRLHNDLANAVEALKTSHAAAGLLALLALSFGYGIVHAAGPGHGKAVISSYVLANQETVRRGIALSFVSAIVQALTAVALVGVLAIALNASGARITGWTNILEVVSYALIAALGLYLLARQLRGLFPRLRFSSSATAGMGHAGQIHSHHPHTHDRSCGCGHAHAPHPDALRQPVTLKSMASVVAAVGIRPCTGAILVLVFALAQGLFWAGVAATFAMALGTALTVSALAVLAVGSRHAALRLAGDGRAWGTAIWKTCGIGGAAAIFLLGAILLAAALGPARPF